MQTPSKNVIVTLLAICLVAGLVGVVALLSGGKLGNFSFSTGQSQVAAAAASLASADPFAVLAGSTITNTGSSVINGDIGLSPGTSATGFPPGIVHGAQHIADANANQAQVDLTAAYIALGQTPVSTIPTELGGTTKQPGIYDSADGTFGLTGTLTLDAAGDPNAVFIFKTASTLITAGASDVILINGAQACNVFWQVGSSATLGINATFKGNIMAQQSITLTTGAGVEGSVLARNGAVTLDSNIITKATCAVVPPLPTPVTVSVPIATSTPIVVTTASTVVDPAPSVVTTAVLPKLPNTGFGPESSDGISWNMIIAAGILTVIFAAYLLARKKKLI